MKMKSNHTQFSIYFRSGRVFSYIVIFIMVMVTMLNSSMISGQSTPTSTIQPFGVKPPDQMQLEQRVRETLKANGETIRFMENKGQVGNTDVLYYFESSKGSVYIEHDRIRFVAIKDTLVAEEEEEEESPDVERKALSKEKTRLIQGTHTFSLHMDGANPAPHIKLGDSFITNYNYFLGQDASKWSTGVNASKELLLEDVYPGIDLRLYSNADGTLEFDWIMDAGADFNQIKMQFNGQDGLTIDQDGQLKVGLRFTDVKFNIPESYQVTDQGKVPVSFSFNQSNENTIGFATQTAINSKFPLVIDPTLT